MAAKSLPKAKVREFLAKLIATARTAAPVSVPGGYYRLRFVTTPDEVALGCNYLYGSAKSFVFPPLEALLRQARQAGLQFEPVAEAEPVILFGLHPCDLNALWTIDAPFQNGGGDPDVHYIKRRENLTLVGVDCAEPCDEDCFCKDMKTHRVQGHYDLLLTDIGDSYAVAIGSDKGAKLADGLPKASVKEMARAKEWDRKKDSHFPTRIGYDTAELPRRIAASYDSPLWEKEAKLCFSCGSCNLVCPTCYCFDMFDELALDLNNVVRKRRWDGCQLEQFAVVAGGENFRRNRSERLRHRCLRKGKYIQEKFGRPGCVGCGRCIRACTADISILEIFNQLTEEQKDGPKNPQ
jgi:ferredoxin